MHGDPDHGISVHILVECQSKNINPIIIPFNVQHYLNNKTPETYQLKKIIKLRRKKFTSIFYNQLGTIPRVIGKNLKNFYYLIIFNSKFGYLCHFYFFCKYLPILKIHKTKKQNYFPQFWCLFETFLSIIPYLFKVWLFQAIFFSYDLRLTSDKSVPETFWWKLPLSQTQVNLYKLRSVQQ